MRICDLPVRTVYRGVLYEVSGEGEGLVAPHTLVQLRDEYRRYLQLKHTCTLRALARAHGIHEAALRRAKRSGRYDGLNADLIKRLLERHRQWLAFEIEHCPEAVCEREGLDSVWFKNHIAAKVKKDIR